MKLIKKLSLPMFVILLLTPIVSVSVSAEGETGSEDVYEEVVDPNYVESEVLEPETQSSPGYVKGGPQYDTGGYWTGWKIYSKTRMSDVYGPTVYSEEAWGPGVLNLTTALSVSNSYTGTLKVAKSALDASMGFNVSTTYSRSVSYSITPPPKEQWQIIYKRRYDKWKVQQRYYIHQDGADHYTNTYQTVYPKKFDAFSFDYIVKAYR
ncbi:hypothetical protein [Bacillus weihaiensis]|uniref:hypothetical protein n=1 Tax=Bacillus weihaiensis TaxID=1547283 RepID=UPI0023561EFE|nr:hypothetical protein [Bacillus weihaiensis]